MGQIFTATEARAYLKKHYNMALSWYTFHRLVREKKFPGLSADPIDRRAYQIRQEDLDAWAQSVRPQRPDLSRFDGMKLVMRLNSEEDAETRYFLYQEPEPMQETLHFVVADWSGVRHDVILSVQDAIKIGLIQKAAQ